jgi:hypothetical protein
MYELPTVISDVSVLLSLEPEELGAKLLFLMRKRLQGPGANNGMFLLGNQPRPLRSMGLAGSAGPFGAAFGHKWSERLEGAESPCAKDGE